MIALIFILNHKGTEDTERKKRGFPVRVNSVITTY